MIKAKVSIPNSPWKFESIQKFIGAFFDEHDTKSVIFKIQTKSYVLVETEEPPWDGYDEEEDGDLKILRSIVIENMGHSSIELN